MKKFNINVNGKKYEVEVEELVAGDALAQNNQQDILTKQPPVIKNTVIENAPVQPSKSNSIPDSGEGILAPMPGTILDIRVSEQQQIKAGEIILILEAMKMENEIVSPKDGTVLKLYATKGLSVNTGELLVDIG